MTRFILSYVMLLVLVVAGSVTARASTNSKRPTASAPTPLAASHLSAEATADGPAHASRMLPHAIAHAAKMKVVALASVLREKVRQAASAAGEGGLAMTGAEALRTRLARVTAYWSGEGDYYTRHHISSTGVHLHQGHCAVDPSIIPYGSVVRIAGLGSYVAVDTGTAVVSRRAARESGHTRDQRNALVIDLYFESRRAGEQFAANGPKFASITWFAPGAEITSDPVADSGSLIASGDEPGRSKAL
jgi:3D (Asp-Asp-Asp) domain-containing protein